MTVELSITRIQAVPTAADSWTAMGTAITVPAGVKRIRNVQISVAPDWGTSAISVRFAPVIRLTGDGLGEQSPHAFLGEFGGTAVVTTAGYQKNSLNYNYDVDIPVQSGGTITAEINGLDEVITAGTSSICLTYDDTAPKLKNSMSAYVDAAGTTTADAWTTVGTFTVPQPTGAQEPKYIRAICIGIAEDEGTSAISLRTALRIRLTGDGLKFAGSHEFIGAAHSAAQIGAAASQGSALYNHTWIIPCMIEVNAGGAILAEHIFDIETPTASTVAVGLLYGA